MKSSFVRIRFSDEARLGIASLIVVGLMVAVAGLFAPEQERHSGIISTPLPQISEHEIVRGNTTKKQVIFTFDAGDSDRSINEILSALSKYHVKGTFFVTGKFAQIYPDAVKSIVAGGHEIFSHTFDHPHLPTLSDQEIVREFVRTEAVLESIASTSPKPFFRAPYGDRDERVLSDAFKAGYESVYWSIDAGDWMEPQGETDSIVRSRIMDTLSPGNIYLMHVGDTITGRILDGVFADIEAKGYKIVSLTQGL